MGLRDFVTKAKEADGRDFAPKFLYKIIKTPGQYRVRLYKYLASEDGFPGLMTTWYWPAEGEKGVRKKLSDGGEEAKRRQQRVDALRIKGDAEKANKVAATPEYWFSGVLSTQPTMMRILDLHSQSQFEKVAVAIANASQMGVWTKYELTPDFEAAFDAGFERIAGPNGMDLIINVEPEVNPATGKKNRPGDKYSFRVATAGNEALPIPPEGAFDLKAAALEEDGGGR